MSIGRFERMVGIPEDEYYQLKNLQRTADPIQNKFMTLSEDYRKQSFIENPHVRVQRQGETLNEMINVKDELRNRLVQGTPKPYRTRAQSLFEHIASKVIVNEKGEMQDQQGKVIEGSNIADLIQHAVRDRRRNIIPTGWNSFLNILKDNNTPQMILNYDTLSEMGNAQVIKQSVVKRPIVKVDASTSPIVKQPKVKVDASTSPIQFRGRPPARATVKLPPVKKVETRSAVAKTVAKKAVNIKKEPDYKKTKGQKYI